MDNYYANGVPTGSMVEPSNPNLQAQWQAAQRPKKSHSWLFPCIIGVIIVAVVIVAIIAISTNVQTPTLEEQITILAPDDDVNSYFASLVADPDYEPNFISSKTKYSNVPDGLTCSALKEVKHMNLDIMNLYLNASYVVAISSKDKTILVYSGDLNESSYKTISINCPNQEITKTSAYKTYDGKDIFNNLKSDQHYYVWSETMGVTSGE